MAQSPNNDWSSKYLATSRNSPNLLNVLSSRDLTRRSLPITPSGLSFLFTLGRYNIKMKSLSSFVTLSLCFLCLASVANATPYLLGAGKADITGPPGDVLMMGYVKLSQKTAGIHTRLWARAFVMAEVQSNKRVVIVASDLLQIPQGVKQKVIEKLREKFGDLYSDENVLLSASHTHSGPGGYSHYQLYKLINLGFSEQNFNGVVEGVVRAISAAHASAVPGRLKWNRGELRGASRNRAIEAYVLNPSTERDKYSDDTDKEMTLLRMETTRGEPIASLNWFAVHATSIKSSNHLISADNKGLAQTLFEKEMPAGFISAFANSNAGDVTPNISKDLDGDDHWDCPLIDGFLCAESSARQQYATARRLYDSAYQTVSGPIDFRHQYVNFSKVKISEAFSDGVTGATTCPAAVGVSMLAGTKDGRGVGKEGVNCSSGGPGVQALCLRDRCHGEKPIALSLGYHSPYPWTPEVLPVQIVRLGALAIVAVPAEFTTMSGRRLRNTVREILSSIGVEHVILAGYSNAYAGYVATREEYQGQQYEGASTHFGEWTLAAYQQSFATIAQAMANFSNHDPGPTPRDLSSVAQSTKPNVSTYDNLAKGTNFGDVLDDAKRVYPVGCEVRVSFVSANPNRNVRHGDSYLELQKLIGTGWSTVATDDDWNTRFMWNANRRNISSATVAWNIPASLDSVGTYRLVHRGTANSRARGRLEFQGTSQTFEVSPNTGNCP